MRLISFMGWIWIGSICMEVFVVFSLIVFGGNKIEMINYSLHYIISMFRLPFTSNKGLHERLAYVIFYSCLPVTNNK